MFSVVPKTVRAAVLPSGRARVVLPAVRRRSSFVLVPARPALCLHTQPWDVGTRAACLALSRWLHVSTGAVPFFGLRDR